MNLVRKKITIVDSKNGIVDISFFVVVDLRGVLTWMVSFLNSLKQLSMEHVARKERRHSYSKKKNEKNVFCHL